MQSVGLCDHQNSIAVIPLGAVDGDGNAFTIVIDRQTVGSVWLGLMMRDLEMSEVNVIQRNPKTDIMRLLMFQSFFWLEFQTFLLFISSFIYYLKFIICSNRSDGDGSSSTK